MRPLATAGVIDERADATDDAADDDDDMDIPPPPVRLVFGRPAVDDRLLVDPATLVPLLLLP